MATDLFRDKTAIVTGAASGIGRAMAKALGGRGAFVVVADRNGEGAARTEAEIGAAGGSARAAVLDVADEAAVRALVDATVSDRGRLDYMFNNAGIAVAGEHRDVALDQWRAVVDVDFWGVLYGTTAAYEVMVGQGSGHIVNTASLAGLVASPMQGSYTASKHAVVGLSRGLRLEGADLGVRVSVVCPGLIDTAIFETTPAMRVDLGKFLETNPLRAADPARLAQAVLRGLERNQAIIVYPMHARLILLLDRFLPKLSELLWGRYVREFRKLRREGGELK